MKKQLCDDVFMTIGKVSTAFYYDGRLEIVECNDCGNQIAKRSIIDDEIKWSLIDDRCAHCMWQATFIRKSSG